MTAFARLTIDVALADGADASDIAERLFNFLASDPDDLLPEIETVDNYGYQWIDA